MYQIFIIAAILISIIFLICIISIIECNSYKIVDYQLENTKNNSDFKFVFISDFHNKRFKHLEKLVKNILNLNPDFIILGGDFVNYSRFNKFFKKIELENAKIFITELCKNFNKSNSNNNYNLNRIFFSFGNHELRLKDSLENKFKDFIDFLKTNNIEVLDNNYIDIFDDVRIYGLSLYDGYYNKAFLNLCSFKHITSDTLNSIFKPFDSNKFNITLYHKPDYAEDLIYYGSDLVLSGHNHGGLIKFPFFGALFSPDLAFLPKYNYGLYKCKNKYLIVSAGLGEHFLKIRVNNKPEICFIRVTNGKNNL